MPLMEIEKLLESEIHEVRATYVFKIAELLLEDKEDLVHKGAGWMLRFAGDKDRRRLLAFLDQYAATMPRIMLRNCIEHFTKKKREHYLSLKNSHRSSDSQNEIERKFKTTLDKL